VAAELAVRAEDRAHTRLWQDLVRCSGEEARALIPLELAHRLRALPLMLVPGLDGARQLVVIIGEPHNAAFLAELRFAAGCEIITEGAPPDEVEKAIFAAYRGDPRELAQRIDQTVDALVPQPAGDDLLSPPAGSGAPGILESLLSRAVALTASDIHLEPDSSGLKLRLRVDGLLRREKSFFLPPEPGSEIIRRIKVLAGIDTTGTKRVADGAFTFNRPGAAFRIRVSIVPQLFGEKAVLRILDAGIETQTQRAEDPFIRLGLSREQSACLRAALGQDSGIILLAGPTGSGKSTLLAAALEALRTPWRSIVTVEDPVERILPGISQTDLSQMADLSYEDVLPALLRQDPDVIMIGEIRETRSARLAFEASITGHLLLTTIHAGDCMQAIARVLELTRKPELVSHALRLIITSRLIPENCPACAAAEHIAPELAMLFCLAAESRVRAGRGCAACNGFGHRGRIGAFELLAVDERLRRLIAPVRSGAARLPRRSQLLRAARDSGYRPLAQAVRRLLLEGKIAPFHALRSLGIAPEAAGYEERAMP
jgi:type II secretory ATPase GspE/PulE/Tfp pilus assembly ATPase PilB-like protein